MQIVKQFKIACLNAKQIAKGLAVACRLCPALVCFFRLLAEAQRDAAPFGDAFFDAHAVNATQDVFDKGDEPFIRAFTCLQGHRAVTGSHCVAGRLNDFVWSQRIALSLMVALADTAVTAVVDAIVADFDKSAKPQRIAVHAGGAVVGFTPQTGTAIGIGQRQEGEKIFVGECVFGQNGFKRLQIHT